MSFENFSDANQEDVGSGDLTQSKSKGKREFKNGEDLGLFLEREVFPAFGISAEDEKKYLENIKHQSNIELMDRIDTLSFPNIRDSVRMFLEYYCKNGIYNHEKMRAERKEAEEKVWNDFWQEEGGRVNGGGERIDSKGRPLTYWENERTVEEGVSNLFPVGYLEKNKIVFDTEEVIGKLFKELARIRENSALTYNVNFDALEEILRSGKILPMTEQPEDKKETMRKTGGLIGSLAGADNEGYESRREESERVMGIYQKGKARAVYASLAGGSDGSLERGAAPQYGEIVVVFDGELLQDRVVFVEGDSMNPMGMIDAIRPKRDLSPRNGLEHRLINREHAQIAKAMYNLSWQLEESYYGKGDDLIGARAVQYIEAAMLDGVDMSCVKEIVVNIPKILFGMEEFKKDYPQYANLMRFAEVESGIG